MVETAIKAVYIRRLEIHEDNRGWLSEIFRNDELREEIVPAMSYISVTRPGITRGPHEHTFQTDLLAFPGISSFRIILWDNRKDSATYGQKIELESSERAPLCLVIPPGVVHAYTNTGDIDGVTVNSPNRLYRGSGKKEEVDETRYEEQPENSFKM